ncbi:PPP4R2-domain-containing protein [Scleroderma yunnanense]
MSLYTLSQTFEWRPDYDSVLERIATTDIIEPDIQWGQLRDMIKYKLEQNISVFLSDAEQGPQIIEAEPPNVGTPDSAGNLRLAPFPPRKRNDLNPVDTPKVYMNREEANEMKDAIFKQLHEFDEDPPFTIQRVCELCVYPKRYYKAIGKYLRAVEKSLLVTSAWNSFPPETPQNGLSLGGISTSPTMQPVPTTPMFSPIPFLHGDARRSRSHSPPPSPLMLGVMETSENVEPLDEEMPQRAIGLVDELDDPGPGHMSEHPTAITAVTTSRSRPFIDSLENRFVREGKDVQGGTAMAVDGSDDKENKE